MSEVNTYARVTGSLQLSPPEGSIDYVVPSAHKDPSEAGDDKILLIGRNAEGSTLFTLPVQVLRNSCVPDSNTGTFQETIPVSPDLKEVDLSIYGTVVATFTSSSPPVPSLSLAGPGPDRPNRLNVASAAFQEHPGVTFTIQARESGSERWTTLAVGLEHPSTNVDINQFPLAESIDLRVLQSNGFSDREILRETRKLAPE